MKLSEYLETRNLSQAAFAQLLGVSQVAVSRYATGQRMPRRDHLRKIREATGGAVTADDFLEIVEAAE